MHSDLYNGIRSGITLSNVFVYHVDFFPKIPELVIIMINHFLVFCICFVLLNASDLCQCQRVLPNWPRR